MTLEGGLRKALPGFRGMSPENRHQALSSCAKTTQGHVWGELCSPARCKHSAHPFHTNNNSGSKNHSVTFFFPIPRLLEMTNLQWSSTGMSLWRGPCCYLARKTALGLASPQDKLALCHGVSQASRRWGQPASSGGDESRHLLLALLPAGRVKTLPASEVTPASIQTASNPMKGQRLPCS